MELAVMGGMELAVMGCAGAAWMGGMELGTGGLRFAAPLPAAGVPGAAVVPPGWPGTVAPPPGTVSRVPRGPAEAVVDGEVNGAFLDDEQAPASTATVAVATTTRSISGRRRRDWDVELGRLMCAHLPSGWICGGCCS
jgi:hypothetical protein